MKSANLHFGTMMIQASSSKKNGVNGQIAPTEGGVTNSRLSPTSWTHR